MSRDLQANSLKLLGHAQTKPGPPMSVAVPVLDDHRVNPFDLLGLAQPPRIGVLLPGHVQPKFNIAWNSFHQNFLSGIPVFFSFPRTAKTPGKLDVFRDCRVEPNFPRRAVIAGDDKGVV